MTKTHQNKIFSFYSFKGGVGRTQLLGNIAAYLCHNKDARILILDWDMEAPGIHFLFGKKNEQINKRGILGILEAYTKLAESERTNQFSKEEYPELYVSYEDIFPLIAPTETSKGKIDLLPAGNYSLQYEFFMQASAFAWTNFYQNLGGGDYLENVKNELKKLEYDYIFIDSRTGINDYTNIVNIQMSDCDVLVMAPTEQNFAGCRLLANKIRNSKYVSGENAHRKGFILPILSRFVEESEDRKYWLKHFTDEFSYLLPALSKYELKDLRKTFDGQYLFKTKLNHVQIMGEKVFFQEKEEVFTINDTLEYNIINIANFLTEIKENNCIDFSTIETDTNNQDTKPKTEAEAYLNMGNSFAFLGKYEEAIEQYQKAIEIKPDYHEAWYNLGNTCSNLKSYDEAILAYQKAIEIKPDLHEAWHNLGTIHAKQENYEEAIVSYQKVIDVNPDFYKAWFNLGNIYSSSVQYKKGMNELDRAIIAYQKATEIKLDYHEAWYNLGNVHYFAQNYSDAIIAYQKTTNIKPDFYEAWNNLGSVYNAIKDYDNAVLAYKKSLDIRPNFQMGWDNLGVAYLYQKQYDQAKNCFEKALSIQPNDDKTLFNFACLYSLQEDKTQALAYLKRAIEQNLDYKAEARTDTDFEWLWEDADFLALVGE